MGRNPYCAPRALGVRYCRSYTKNRWEYLRRTKYNFDDDNGGEVNSYKVKDLGLLNCYWVLEVKGWEGEGLSRNICSYKGWSDISGVVCLRVTVIWVESEACKRHTRNITPSLIWS